MDASDFTSGGHFVISIGFGFLVFCMGFLFVKRQITRFTLKSSRGPHIPVGHDTNSELNSEIKRRLLCSTKITKEPRLYDDEPGVRNAASCRHRRANVYSQFDESQFGACTCFFRMKAVDSLSVLGTFVRRLELSMPVSSMSNDMSKILHKHLHTNTPHPALRGVEPAIVDEYIQLYDQAKHSAKEFGEHEYQRYMQLLSILIASLKKKFPRRKRRPEGGQYKPKISEGHTRQSSSASAMSSCSAASTVSAGGITTATDDPVDPPPNLNPTAFVEEQTLEGPSDRNSPSSSAPQQKVREKSKKGSLYIMEDIKPLKITEKSTDAAGNDEGETNV